MVEKKEKSRVSFDPMTHRPDRTAGATSHWLIPQSVQVTFIGGLPMVFIHHDN